MRARRRAVGGQLPGWAGPSAWLRNAQAAPILKVTSARGPTPGQFSVASSATALVPVPAVALTWHAIYTGGPLPASANWWSHLTYRSACAATLWACVEARHGEWRATSLYRDIETTDKAQASYRIGTLMAGVAGEFALDIQGLTHRQTMFGSSSGQRGDLVGRRLSTGSYHGIEAKGRSPRIRTGVAQTISPAQLADAKTQAKNLGTDLQSQLYFTGGGDNWAVHSLASVTAPFELLVEDPEGEDTEPPVPIDPGADFPDDDPEERIWQGYFQVVGDIEEGRQFGSTNERAQPQLIDGYLGLQVPGTALWLGARQELFDARRDRRRAQIVGEIAVTSRIDEPTVYSAMGLHVVVLISGNARDRGVVGD
jgi:hypothetical protein